MTIGIHRMSLSTTAFALPLHDLALHRGIDPDKFDKGLGQKMMSVPTPQEDHISLAVDAGLRLLTLNPEFKQRIDLLIIATESATDYAKAAAIFVHEMLQLNRFCRSIEMKQACYSGVFGLRTAVSFIAAGQSQCALVIASDISHYERHSAAESSQGAAAVAMIIQADPDLLVLEAESVSLTQSARDFYRPSGAKTPIVDGKYSCLLYLKMLETLRSVYHGALQDMAAFCCHTPIPRLAEKAAAVLKWPIELMQRNEQALIYNRLIGNTYTASIFMSLCSLLDNSDITESSQPQRILCYSYGSGATAELFTLQLQPSARDYLDSDYHKSLIYHRQRADIAEYEHWHQIVGQSLFTEGLACLKNRTRKVAIDRGYPLYIRPETASEPCYDPFLENMAPC
jgi:hydroxymethylglutaryl-CoA synthase